MISGPDVTSFTLMPMRELFRELIPFTSGNIGLYGAALWPYLTCTRSSALDWRRFRIRLIIPHPLADQAIAEPAIAEPAGLNRW